MLIKIWLQKVNDKHKYLQVSAVKAQKKKGSFKITVRVCKKSLEIEL